MNTNLHHHTPLNPDYPYIGCPDEDDDTLDSIEY
jgi:hypothetical protein